LHGRRKVNLTREKKIEKRKEGKERKRKREREREREREMSGEGEKKESIYLRRTQAHVRGERPARQKSKGQKAASIRGDLQI